MPEPGWLKFVARLLHRTRLSTLLVGMGTRVFEDRAQMRLRELDFHAIGQSHIDAAWKWTRRQTIRICLETFENVFRKFERYPGFTFSQPCPLYYQWIMDRDPALFSKIKEQLGRRWHILGGMWVEADLRMPSGESLVRQRLYGQRFFIEKFGKTSRVAFAPDSFGFPSSLPQILSKSGADAFLTHKPLWNQDTAFPFASFHWRGCDGTQILTYVADIGYTVLSAAGSREPQRMLLNPGQHLRSDYTCDDEEILSRLSDEPCSVQIFGYGAGDGGHGPFEAEIAVVEALARLGWIRHSDPDTFVQALSKEAERLPVWEDEIYLELHRGTLTTLARIKLHNRRSEEMLTSLEKLLSICLALGHRYPRRELEQMWKTLLFNQFHDVLSGTCIPEVYQEAEEDFLSLRKTASQLEREGMEFLLRSVFKQSDARASQDKALQTYLTIFSPTSAGGPAPVCESLSSLAEAIGRDPDELREGISLIDGGRRLPHQFVLEPVSWPERPILLGGAGGKEDLSSLNSALEESILTVVDLPPIGIARLQVAERRAAQQDSSAGLGISDLGETVIIENDVLRVSVSKSTGNLVSIYSKQLGVEALSGEGNKYALFRDRGGAWNIEKGYRSSPVPCGPPLQVKVVEEGPVRATVEIVGRLGNSSYLKRVSLYAALPGVYMDHIIAWRDADSILKVCFPLSIDPASGSSVTVADCPYGAVLRRMAPQTPREEARWEVCCQRWVTVQREEDGHCFTLLNDSKYGFSVDGGVLELTLLRGPGHPPPSQDSGIEADSPRRPTHADVGQVHVTRTALFVNRGTWETGAAAPIEGEMFNAWRPLMISRLADLEDTPHRISFVQSSNPAVMIAAVKAPEPASQDIEVGELSGGELVVRVFNAVSSSQRTTISLFLPVATVVELDLLERETSPPRSLGGPSFDIELGPFEIRTLKLKLGGETRNAT